MATLPHDHVKALDQLRSRLSKLSQSIATLRGHLVETYPHQPPTWPTLQADASMLGANLAELADALALQKQLYASVHGYPLPNFPGNTHHMNLQGLLRKKLEQRAEDWIKGALDEEEDSAPNSVASKQHDPSTLPDDKMEHVWQWARAETERILKPMIDDGAFEDDYTLAERAEGVENVVTGIKRIDEYEGESDDEDKMEQDKASRQEFEITPDNGVDTSKPAVPVDMTLRFYASGDLRA